jgi:hypothetical protein
MKKVIYFLVLILFSCKTQEFPPKHADLSDREYDKYCKELKEARAKKDYFSEGVSLCSLKQPPEKIYKPLHKSIIQHDTLCYKIHQYQDFYKSNGFQVNILRSDTTRWKGLCAECERIVPIENYYEKKIKEELAYQKKRDIAKSKLDTTLFDKKLIASLAVIIEKDQRVRGMANLKEKDRRWGEQKQLDSLNLIQIDAIFKVEGTYPRLQKIGYDQLMTPWYVLQHQSSSVIRRKYMHFIEEAVQKGELNKNVLDNFRERTIGIEEKEIRP